MKLTNISARPINDKPIKEASHRPILWPSGPNKFVPKKMNYEINENGNSRINFSWKHVLRRSIICVNIIPIRYEMEAGKKAAPSCHFSASIWSIIKIGKDGSNMAIPILANVIAPEKDKKGQIFEFWLYVNKLTHFLLNMENTRNSQCPFPDEIHMRCKLGY